MCFDFFLNKNLVVDKKKNCAVFSIGSNNDFSFDDEMNGLGCEVHTFDPTLNWSWEKVERKPGAYQYGIGIADVSGIRNNTVHKYVEEEVNETQKPEPSGAPSQRRKEKKRKKKKRVVIEEQVLRSFKSLRDMLKIAGHEHVDILKLDVEGNEWEVLDGLLNSTTLDKIDQFMVELHFYAGNGFKGHFIHSVTLMHHFYKVLLRLTEKFDIFAYHSNPRSTLERLPKRTRCCYEISLIAKRLRGA